MSAYARLLGIALGVFAVAADVIGAESIATGKIKGVELEKRQFVFTDQTGTDRTVKYDEDTVINRGGRDGQSDFKVDDAICLYYETSGLMWRASYVLIQEGDTKNWSLGHGNVKSINAEKNEMTYVDDKGRDWTYPTSSATVFINRTKSKVESIKVGEHVMALLQKAGDRTTLKSLYVTRK